MSSAAPVLTVVTYHYVRNIAHSPWPDIKGLEIAQFKQQLEYLLHHHTPIDMSLLFAKSRGEPVDWPRCPLLLTFDDGYLEHFETAFKVMSRLGVSGAFFAPTSSLLDRKMLDVNKVHFILAKTKDHDRLGREIDGLLCDRLGTNTQDEISQFRADLCKPSRWDQAATVYVKRILQRGPSPTIRSDIVDVLFRRHVSEDEASFAEELYMSPAQAREMVEAGMHFGSHGDQHIWFNHSSREAQENDIKSSLRLRDALGLNPNEYSFCYPYGGYNDTTLELMRQNGFSLGFTTRLALNPLDSHTSMMELARIDAGADVAMGRDGEINDWTRQAQS